MLYSYKYPVFCEQGRIRVLVIAAAAGEMMPPFPEPTHLVKEFDHTVKGNARFTDVGFISEASIRRAHPPVLIADALDDLPPVSNLCYRECRTYATPPTTPYQVSKSECKVDTITNHV